VFAQIPIAKNNLEEMVGSSAAREFGQRGLASVLARRWMGVVWAGVGV